MTGFTPQGPQYGSDPNNPSGGNQSPPWGQPGSNQPQYPNEYSNQPQGQNPPQSQPQGQPDAWADPADDPWSKQSEQWNQPGGWQQQAPTQQFPAPSDQNYGGYQNQPGGYGYQGQPGQSGGQPPTGGGKNRMLLIGGGVGLILVLVVVIAVVALSGGKKKNTSGGDTKTSSTKPAAAKKASDAVKGYLNAIASNDAKTALSYTDTPGETAFLTDDALKAAHEKAPMSAVTVPDVGGDYYATVNVTYTLGTQNIAADIRAKQDGGVWKVEDGVTNVDFSNEKEDGIKLLINGTEATTDTVNLFPGSYVISTDNANISYGADNTILVKGSDSYVSTSKLDLTLSATGLAAVKAAASTALASCVASKSPTPTGCSSDWKVAPASGTTFVPNTLTYKLTNNPLASLKFDLDYDNKTTASDSVSIEVRADAQAKDSGQTIPEYKNLYIYAKFSVDLTKSPLVCTIGD